MTCQFIDSSTPGFSYYHFTEEGFSCKIVPAFGGSLQELIVEGVTIIEGTSPDQPGFENYLQKCFSALLFPFPNRIKNGSYTFEKNAYTLPINEPENKNAIHGLVFDQPFETVSYGDHTLTMRYHHHGCAGFPFQFVLNITYTVHVRSVQIEFHIQNIGTSTFPYGIGWHPYFETVAGKRTSINFNSDKKYEVDESMIPCRAENIEETVFDLTDVFIDNAFRLSGQNIHFRTEAYKLRMEVPPDSYLQLYTPPGRNSVAIEPMSCISNAFNNEVGLNTLKSGATSTWKVQLDIEIN